MHLQWSFSHIIISDALHILWGLIWLAPISVVLALVAPRIKSRVLLIVIILLFLVAAMELHVWADMKDLKLFGQYY